MGLVLLASFISLTSVSAGSGLGALVSQHPSRTIRISGASVEIQCRVVDLQALTIFWYRQFPEQGLILMVTSNMGSSATYEQGFTEAKFPIIHPNQTFSTLTVTSAHPADSSLYFCGASDTALGRDQRPKQEPLPLFPTHQTRGALWKEVWREKTTAPLMETSVWRERNGEWGGGKREKESEYGNGARPINSQWT